MSWKTIVHFSDDNFYLKEMPVLLFAGQEENDPNWKSKRHRHNHCEIIYITEGKGNFIINNVPYEAKKGDVIIYNKGIVHVESSNKKNPISIFYCGVGNLFIEGLPKGMLIPNEACPVVPTGNYQDKIENYITGIVEECSQQNIGYNIFCQSQLVSLIILIIRILFNDENPILAKDSTNLSKRIKDYIDKNYFKDLSIDALAHVHNVSRYYLSHRFKKDIKETPIRYQIIRRIEEAKRLLQYTNMTIHEISNQVGYENANYFHSIFRKYTKLSPGSFRIKAKKHDLSN